VMASLDRYNDATKVTARVADALAGKVAAVKVHEFDLDVIEAARKVVGRQMPFVADCNNAHALADVENHRTRWQALDLLWLEDPVWPPEALLEQPKLHGIVIGLGADLGSAEQLAVYARPPVGVLQPDICMIGGVSETRRAVALLGPHGVSIAPHTPFIGPAGLATLHFLATMKEAAYYAVIEAAPHMDMYGDSGLTRWQPELTVPTAPGLGIDPDPAFLERYRQ
jgi:D-galactarolactone cycloisomerase